jgi:hypothetical protein
VIFTLRLRAPEAGTNLNEALSDAHRIAVVLNVTVEFEFNGILLDVSPGDSTTDIKYDYHDRLNERWNARVSR